MLPTSPSSVLVCTHGSPPKELGVGRPVVLGRLGATIVAATLDGAPAGAANCSSTPDEVLRFAYLDGTEADVEVFFSGCAAPTASAAGHVWLLEPQFASYLDTDAGARWLPGTSVPDLTGLSLARAAAAGGAAGLTVGVGGRTTDPAVPPGTVVLQDPPAGTGDIGNEVDLLLSQLPAPACAASQLAIDYHGLSYGSGENFATLDVRDISSRACQLVGPVSVLGLDRAGATVTNAEVLAVAPDLILTPHAAKRDTALDPPVPTDTEMAWIQLGANVRDGPDANGSCVRHLVVPAIWSITIAGAVMRVPNGDAAEPSFSACQGRLDVPVPSAPITAFSS